MTSKSRRPAQQDRLVLTPQRWQFRQLITANPNHFGTFPDLPFEVVEPMKGNTAYEDVGCVSYSPTRDRIEATINVKQSFGYSGGPCTNGSFEHLRFYIDYGSGWEDAGPAAIKVHDFAEGKDCPGDPLHPLSYVASVPHVPHRKWCGTPVLPRVRVILSWNLPPTPGDPDFPPVWGDVHECNVQIAPRRFFFGDIIHLLPSKVVQLLPQKVIEQVPIPHPDPDPGPLLTLAELADQYANTDVPQHRFAFPAAMQVSDSEVASSGTVTSSALMAQAAKVNLAEIFKLLEDTKGNVDFEELECLGLDEGLSSLVATFNVKQGSGYSGGPCTAGSTEYVAFWADWDDDCSYNYLGTVQVPAHDYAVPPGGLCYAAIQPVDLGALRRPCDVPRIARVRAVLSWGTPPSTTDPDKVPVWGNRIDRHVQIEPGPTYDGTAHFTIVGGVAANKVSLVTGLTDSGATLGTSTVPLNPPSCPFAGQLTLQGPNDPTLAGHQYRIKATNLDSGGFVYLDTPFGVVNSNGDPATVTPTPGTGWATWPTWVTNTEGFLGVHTPGGNDQWDYTLELDTAGHTVDTARVQMDNLVRNEVVPLDGANAGDLWLDTAGACKVPKALLNARFVARDLHFSSWSISLLGGPGGNPPQPALHLPGNLPMLPTTSQTPLTGTDFTIDLTDPLLAPCGYVVRLTIVDRAIVNSVTQGQHATIDRGICLE
jgi:hypothetical protein